METIIKYFETNLNKHTTQHQGRTSRSLEKVALQIHSWQVDANIFKVMRYSLLRGFYLVSLFFVAL